MVVVAKLFYLYIGFDMHTDMIENYMLKIIRQSLGLNLALSNTNKYDKTCDRGRNTKIFYTIFMSDTTVISHCVFCFFDLRILITPELQTLLPIRFICVILLNVRIIFNHHGS